MLLHPKQVCRALYYGNRWRLKRALKIPDRPRNPVVDGDSGDAFARHLRICRLLAREIAGSEPRERRVACEIGCGDCLSTSDLFLGAGFERVYLVEKSPIVVDDRQRDLLARLAALDELPNALGSIVESPRLEMNTSSIRLVPEFFEEATLPERVDFLFSHDVLEHVEDLPGFFRKCAAVLAPGGVMVHKFDLSGHEFFEDPIPPLDFQTYPNWLYALMFPKYRRACRRFLDEITMAMTDAGFDSPTIEVLNAANVEYLSQIRGRLRTEARKRHSEQLAPLDIVARTGLFSR